MNHVAVTIILEEHAALSALLDSIARVLRARHWLRRPPDFAALRAMLFYLDEFPEKRHHRKESELLFPKLRARAPWSRELFDRLDRDHARGERTVRELEHALLAFEVLGKPRREAFEQAAMRYVGFYKAHMALEERELLPLAERVLTAADWVGIDDAFAACRDPLAGQQPEVDYKSLFLRIAQPETAPSGLPLLA